MVPYPIACLILDHCLQTENHVVVGELLESKSFQQGDNINTPKSMNGDTTWNPDSESSHVTGGFSIGFSLTVMQVAFSCSFLIRIFGFYLS